MFTHYLASGHHRAPSGEMWGTKKCVDQQLLSASVWIKIWNFSDPGDPKKFYPCSVGILNINGNHQCLFFFAKSDWGHQKPACAKLPFLFHPYFGTIIPKWPTLFRPWHRTKNESWKSIRYIYIYRYRDTVLLSPCQGFEIEGCMPTKTTLWLCQNSYWKWPFRVFPLNMVIFHTYVSLPEGRS